jgi:hypothetical protein
MSLGTMNRSDVHIVDVNSNTGDMLVGAKYGTNGMTWPAVIEYDADQYRFRSNEILTPHLAQHFGGLAKYERVAAE